MVPNERRSLVEVEPSHTLSTRPLMGYFGGLGAGKGWRRFYFLVAPDELQRVLTESGCKLLVVNGRVPLNYEWTEVSDYVAHYSSRLSNPADGAYPTDLHTALVLPGTRFSWRPVEARRKRDEGFKLVDLLEPVVTVAPLHVTWGGDSRLHFSWISREQAWIGLDMQFPNVVSYTSEGCEVLHQTEETPNAALFDLLCLTIRRITKPAVFTTPTGDRKSELRASLAGAGFLGEHSRLAAQGIRLL